MTEYFSLEHVDLVFGNRTQLAFKELDAGKSRDEVQKQTGQIVAVHDVSLQIYQGEILVLMGLSGSGKSSLLRCLNGMNGRGNAALKGALRGSVSFRNPQSGRKVSLTHCSETELLEVRRHRIAMVFQQVGLMPWRTVRDNVRYPLELQGLDMIEQVARAEEKLALVGLLSWKNRYPAELSGGMQQRVGLARAFVTDADVLLMDEPFSALDPIHRRSLQDEVLQLQKVLKKTIVFVSHDFAEARRLADRIAVMQAGRVLQVDAPEELIRNPVCQGVAEFVVENESESGLKRRAPMGEGGEHSKSRVEVEI